MNLSTDATKFRQATAKADAAVAELERETILAHARKALWNLRGEKIAINPTAAHAITAGRHGAAGKEFANTVLAATAAGQGIDAAIRGHLVKGGAGD